MIPKSGISLFGKDHARPAKIRLARPGRSGATAKPETGFSPLRFNVASFRVCTLPPFWLQNVQ
jgi:hypothetical protein